MERKIRRLRPRKEKRRFHSQPGGADNNLKAGNPIEEEGYLHGRKDSPLKGGTLV